MTDTKEYKFEVKNPWWAEAIPRWLADPAHTDKCPEVDRTVDGDKDEYAFGHSIRKSMFLLDEDTVFLNHGSFGAVMKPVLQYQRAFQDLLELQPVKFMEDVALPETAATLDELSAFVRCANTEIVFVNNATSGVNAVVKSFDFKPNDVIVTLSLAYDAVKNTLDFVASRHGASVVHTLVTLPATDEEIVAAARKAIEDVEKDGKTVRLAVYDHITSMPSRIMPVKDLVDHCRLKNIPVLIDGAHAVGAVDLDLHDIGADFYTSNCHKWLCTGKGVAFLYVSSHWHGKIRPATTSHGYKLGFAPEFYWPGTFDPCPQLGTSAALHTIERLGGAKKMRDYNHNLVVRAGQVLMSRWGTDVVLADADHCSTMFNVHVPSQVLNKKGPRDTKELHDLLRDKYGVECPTMIYQGNVFIRISAQIYNTMSDYLHLLEAVNEIIAGHENSSVE